MGKEQDYAELEKVNDDLHEKIIDLELRARMDQLRIDRLKGDGELLDCAELLGNGVRRMLRQWSDSSNGLPLCEQLTLREALRRWKRDGAS